MAVSNNSKFRLEFSSHFLLGRENMYQLKIENGFCLDIKSTNKFGEEISPYQYSDGNFRVQNVPESWGLEKTKKGYSAVTSQQLFQLISEGFFESGKNRKIHMKPVESGEEIKGNSGGYTVSSQCFSNELKSQL